MTPGKRILIFVVTVAVVFLVAIAGLVSLLAVLTYEKVDIRNNAVVAWLMPSLPTSGTRALTDKGNYQTENNWIAARTAEEIAGFAWLAVHPDRPLPQLKVKATVDPFKQHVHLELTGWTDQPVTADLNPAYAWDPKAYAAFAHQLLGDQKAAEPATDTSDLLTDLLSPTGQVLAQKDVELSKALQQNPASASLHEKSALLLLTLALRENAYTLSDIRTELCRASAHLAIAHALGGDANSWSGQVANATLLTLSGREMDALPALDALKASPNSPAAISSWIQLLTLFNKQDWRLVAPDKSSPLLVKIVWFQVVAESFYDSVAMSYLDRLGDLEPVPDWGRALLNSSGSEPAVDVGHRFCESTVSLEFQELKTILEAEGDTLSTNRPLREIFTHPVGASVTADESGPNTLHVIGSDLFKDVAERHIIFAAWQNHFWLRNSWGVPDDDAKFVQQMHALFQGARHEAYLSLNLDAVQPNTFPPVGTFSDDVSEIPPAFAMHLTWPEPDCDLLVPYFGWGIPFGAPFNMKDRCTVVLNAVTSHHHREPNVPSYRDLMPLAPDSYTLASWVVVLNQNQHIPTTEKEEYALMSRFFDYNANAVGYFRSMADEQSDFDEATLAEVYRKQAAMEPDMYYNLGDFLLAHGKTEDAMDAYRQAAAQGLDQVVFANNIKPLVQYDFDHGRQDEAATLAKRAADVFSYDGIETYIWLLCKQGHYDDALDWAGKLEDRYGGEARAYFYAAHADHYPDDFAAEVKKRFPQGMSTVSLATFNGPPTAGCVFKTSSDELARAGLHAGDVVVALDSHRVLNEDTYSFIRAMSDAPVMDLIVWQNGKYVETKASPPNRRFGNDIGDYAP